MQPDHRADIRQKTRAGPTSRPARALAVKRSSIPAVYSPLSGSAELRLLLPGRGTHLGTGFLARLQRPHPPRGRGKERAGRIGQAGTDIVCGISAFCPPTAASAARPLRCTRTLSPQRERVGPKDRGEGAAAGQGIPRADVPRVLAVKPDSSGTSPAMTRRGSDGRCQDTATIKGSGVDDVRWLVERVYLSQPPFAEKVMSDKRLIDVTEIKPDSSKSYPEALSQHYPVWACIRSLRACSLLSACT